MGNDSNEKATVLVVDDEEVIRYTLQKKLSRLGYNVISMEKAEDALYLFKSEEEHVDLVITDIKLRKMDGIELLRRIHGLEDRIPVLIITGHGNVEDAIRALRYGASDFIRKPFDINDIASTVKSLLKRKKEKLDAEGIAKYMEHVTADFSLPVESTIINQISFLLTKDLEPRGLCNNTTAENIALSLQEALSNAMFHGNLGIPSSIREEGGIKGFNEEIERKRNLPEFADSRVQVSYEMNKEYVEYIIDDQGEGFDYLLLPDPRDPENFFMNSGRGLLIIRIHMDEVEWNDKGNRIRLRKYRIQSNNQH